jgi:hypothetical protein
MKKRRLWLSLLILGVLVTSSVTLSGSSGQAQATCVPPCIGSAGNGELPLPNKTLERAWFSHLDPDSTALPGSLWLCFTA